MSNLIYYCSTCGRTFDDEEELDEDAYGDMCPVCRSVWVEVIETDE